jgi:HlyD family secretion protein
MKKLVSILVLIALAGGGFAFWYVRHVQGAENAFRTEPVRQGHLLSTISATGTLEPEEVTDVGAQVVGQIVRFGKDADGKVVDYNSKVTPEMILAEIDDKVYAARVKQSTAHADSAHRKVEQADANVGRSKADVEQSQTKLRLAQRDWERIDALHGPPAVSQAEVDTAESNLETAKAALKVSQATLVQAQAQLADTKAAAEEADAALEQDKINLEYCKIRSPIEGIIIDRRVTLGQTVQSSFNTPSLFLLAKDLKRMTVWVSVNEADVGAIHEGQKVRFTVDAYPRDEFKGTVKRLRLNATMNQNVVTYTVEVAVANPELKLKPYQTANVQFEVGERAEALLVPNSALRWQPRPEQVAPEYRDKYAQKLRNKQARTGQPAAPKQHNTATVWVEDNGLVRPVRLQTGLTDNVSTEVVKVLDGELDKDALVVTGELSKRGGDSKTTNPLQPKPFGK